MVKILNVKIQNLFLFCSMFIYSVTCFHIVWFNKNIEYKKKIQNP
jgi:hypothetical protein